MALTFKYSEAHSDEVRGYPSVMQLIALRKLPVRDNRYYLHVAITSLHKVTNVHCFKDAGNGLNYFSVNDGTPRKI